MSSRRDYSKKILKKLAEKPAVSITEITTPLPLLHKEGRYAVTRSLKNLMEAGYAELRNSDNQKFVKITPKGRARLNSMILESE